MSHLRYAVNEGDVADCVEAEPKGDAGAGREECKDEVELNERALTAETRGCGLRRSASENGATE